MQTQSDRVGGVGGRKHVFDGNGVVQHYDVVPFLRNIYRSVCQPITSEIPLWGLPLP